MTVTDDLRRLLDERGVEYATDDNTASKDTMWTTQNGGWMFDCDYMEPLNAKPGTIGAKTELMIYGYTPEQAIAATLGVGECHDEGGIGSKYPAAFICSECGWSSTVFAFGGNMPQFCPECGRKVKR